jgi:hypothetical protein
VCAVKLVRECLGVEPTPLGAHWISQLQLADPARPRCCRLVQCLVDPRPRRCARSQVLVDVVVQFGRLGREPGIGQQNLR